MSKNVIDLNTADHTTLEPLVGRDQATKLIDYRNQNGQFKSWEDLKKVPGMPTSMIDTLKQKGVTINRKAA